MNIIRIIGENERQQGIYYEYDRDSAPLGEGGMGRIYQGFRVDEGSGGFRTHVAIKAIHDSVARDPQLIERAVREASIQIVHENLLYMYGLVCNVEYDPGFNINTPRYYMVMERLVGVNLDQIINGSFYDRSGFHVPYAEQLYQLYMNNRVEAIVHIMKNVLAGIMSLHEKGFIHRDIDPSNIMVTIDNKIKLVDYGICKHIDTLASEKSLTQAGSFLGKVNYAAPELALGDVAHQNRTTDIYAVGVLIYQLAVGRLPFSGTNQEVLEAQVSRKMPVSDIPNKALRRIVEKATNKKQEKRYASAAEMIADLERVSDTSTNTDPGTNVNTGTNTDRKTSSVILTVVIWVAVAITGLVSGMLLKFILE